MEAEQSTRVERTPTEGRYLLNAVLGAVVGLVLGFVPLSPALGGAVAGYLQGGTRRDGTSVGAASGALAAIPALVFGGLFLTMAVFGGPAPRGVVVVLVFMLAFLVFAALYLVGLGAAGGWAGIYLRERGVGRRLVGDSGSGDVEEADDVEEPTVEA
jgi:hypothetical protein